MIAMSMIDDAFVPAGPGAMFCVRTKYDGSHVRKALVRNVFPANPM